MSQANMADKSSKKQTLSYLSVLTNSLPSDYSSQILTDSASFISKTIKPQVAVSSRRTFGDQHYMYSAQTTNSYASMSQVRPVERSIQAQMVARSITTSGNPYASISKSTTDYIRPPEKSSRLQTTATAIPMSQSQSYSNYSTSNTNSYYSIRPSERSITAQAAASSVRSDIQSFSSFSSSHVHPKERSRSAEIPTQSRRSGKSNFTTSSMDYSISDVHTKEKSIKASTTATWITTSGYQSHSSYLTSSTDSYHSISQVRQAEKSTSAQTASPSRRSSDSLSHSNITNLARWTRPS